MADADSTYDEEDPRSRAGWGRTGATEKVVGIDLGTSNTVVAYSDGGHVRALVAEGNVTTIPSIVSFLPNGDVLVGKEAKERRDEDPENTVFGVKRLLGRVWGDPEVEAARARLPFELRRGKNDSVQVRIRDEFFTLPEISAFVLRKAKAVAEEALGEPVERAVITVPANFNDLQREATKLAGALAGIDVMRILNEPTAASIAYGKGKEEAESVLVYDFGGGTFDVTLLRLSEDVYRVRSTAGDMFLGGDDADLAIAKRFASDIQRKHFFDPTKDRAIFARLLEVAVETKHALSSKPTVVLDVEGILPAFSGQDVSVRCAMSRKEFADVIRPLVSRTIAVCQGALDAAKWTTKDVDRVILVGGSTRMHSVRERVTEFLGREPTMGVDPDEAVALGAALLATGIAADTPRTKKPAWTLLHDAPPSPPDAAPPPRVLAAPLPKIAEIARTNAAPVPAGPSLLERVREKAADVPTWGWVVLVVGLLAVLAFGLSITIVPSE
ncbi:MAG: Hsp70 family protein [Polyangiaceae bacterium]